VPTAGCVSRQPEAHGPSESRRRLGVRVRRADSESDRDRDRRQSARPDPALFPLGQPHGCAASYPRGSSAGGLLPGKPVGLQRRTVALITRTHDDDHQVPGLASATPRDSDN
jgi:hypothetical protein